MTRRDLLQQTFLSAGTVYASKSSKTTRSAKAERSVGRTLAPYLDPLPIPPVISASKEPNCTITLTMRPGRQRIHRDLPSATVWGYNGIWPGPTIEAQRGSPVRVQWQNSLPTRHLLPIDTTIHGAEASLPAVRTVAHLHGAAVHPDHDGYPDAWFTSDKKTGPKFKSALSEYPNDQAASTLWYHDHCIGITRLNVYAGLAGFYLIRDDEEKGLNLPSGEYEIPLMLQDRQFTADGRLLYPKAENGTHPVWIQEFFGDVICVNGKATPFLDVEPRKYRFRILNASNARFYHLQLVALDQAGRPQSRAETPAFHQIGTDGGLMPKPLPLHYLLIAPGERFDVVVDFSEFDGHSFALFNDAPAPYTMGGEYVPAEVMLIKVNKPLSGKDNSELPDRLVSFEALDPSQAERERVLAISELERASDSYVVIGLVGNARWHEPITEDPRAGSTEIWTFANTTGDVHPMHLHLVQFQVLNRQTFDVPTYQQTGKLIFTGRPIAPEANERPAMKDTVKTYPGYLTRVIQQFRVPAGMTYKPSDELLYVWHCHILEHEDNEMMRPYRLLA